MLRNLFQPKEIKAALAYLNDFLALKMQEEGLEEPYELVRKKIEETILSKPEWFLEEYKNGSDEPLENWIMNWVIQIAADKVTTGKCHVFRGVLDESGPGPGFVRLIEVLSQVLVKNGSVTQEGVNEQLKWLHEEISKWG